MAVNERPAGVKVINIEFYAQFREARGLNAETIETRSQTPEELYAELDAKYHFHADRTRTRVAVNDELGDWRAPLAEGDTVVFLTPFGGG